MLTKILIIAYCGLARFFFEFSLPVMCLFMFSKTTALIIWSAFLLWQVLSWWVIKWNKAEQEKATAAKNQKYQYDLWAKALPSSDELDLIEEGAVVFGSNPDEAIDNAHKLAQGWWHSHEIRNFHKA